MFRSVLVANRGEIAVRILRTCHEMGIQVVTLYAPHDRSSLHVRLADESVQLRSAADYTNQAEILRIAQEHGADAIHPGYGFLAEREDFIAACDGAGIRFIGPPFEVLNVVRHKIEVLRIARQAGFAVPEHSSICFRETQADEMRAEAERLGYPVVVKSCRGGRGRGQAMVWSPERLEQAIHHAQMEAQAIYGERDVYLERAVLPAHQIGVQIMGDRYGSLIHLGEREGSLLYGNQKIVEETPSPYLTPERRQEICHTALELARLFHYQNIGTVEFLLNGGGAADGSYYFTEFKPRLQIEHPLTEMLTRVDLVRQQIRLAAGEALDMRQEQVQTAGWALQCRLSAADPLRDSMPSPGKLRRVRLPGGPDVRVDTYLHDDCQVPEDFDPLIAKVAVWAPDRRTCIERMRRALDEFQLSGTATNLPLVQRLLEQPHFLNAEYTTELFLSAFDEDEQNEGRFRDLAVAAALVFVRRNQAFRPSVPERLLGGWHRSSRSLS